MARLKSRGELSRDVDSLQTRVIYLEKRLNRTTFALIALMKWFETSSLFGGSPGFIEGLEVDPNPPEFDWVFPSTFGSANPGLDLRSYLMMNGVQQNEAERIRFFYNF